MLKHCIVYGIFIFLSATAPAQQAKQYVFTRFNRTSGVASNYINNVVQDKNGYMWVATINGLQRFDGNKFITFRNEPGNKNTLPSDDIAFVYFDKANRLWVATADNKVGIFNTENFTYSEVAVRAALNQTLYWPKSFLDADGKLLLVVRNTGLYVLDTAANAFVPSTKEVPIPPGWKILSIKQDTSSRIFYICSDSGIAVYNPLSRQLSYRGRNIANDPMVGRFGKEKFVLDAFVVTGGHVILFIWQPHWVTPVCADVDVVGGQDKQYNLALPLKIGYHEVGGVLQQKNGRLWIFGKPFLTEYSSIDHVFRPIKNEYREEQSIQFDQVNGMYEDREHSVWICTNNGLFVFNPDAQPFNTYNLMRPKDDNPVEGGVVAALQLSNGQTWIGCWGLGLYCYDANFNPVAAPASLQFVIGPYSIWCIHQHSQTGWVWFGLQGGGLIVYNPSTGCSSVFSPPVFRNSTIRQMTEDKQGNLWFGTQNGSIIKWERATAGDDMHAGYTFIVKTGRVYKMITDSKGLIWAATMEHGLLKIDPSGNRIQEFTAGGPTGRQLSTDAPTDIIEYNDSLMMIANHSVDVLNTNTNRIKTINTGNGLPTNNVLCLEKDNHGIVWLGMVNGLCRMNYQQQIFTAYDRSDGITYDNFAEAGAFRLADGRLLFTTEHNFLVFDPGRMVHKNRPPDVEITDFVLSNRSVLVDSLKKLKKISLDFSHNSVAIEFSVLSYLHQNKIVYYYQMEGIDKGWIRADERHQAVYNYIPAGTFTFKVKCVNGYGISSGNITRLVINVQPPFYRTWWFYGTLVLLAIGILYRIDKERFRRVVTLQQVRADIAFNLHQDISTTLNNIHLLSEIAKIKADKDLDKSKEYIDQINSKSRKMIDDMNDMLWSIDPANDNMQKTLEKMQEFAEGLKNTHGCKIEMLVDEEVQALQLDMKTRHEIFFIFKEALNNIIQHSNCTDSIIHIDLIRSSLYLKIHDNGSSFDMKSIQNSNGIYEMEKRARLLNAVLDIQSDKKGTSLILQVPVR